jgi:hypothetical protein
MRLTELEEGNFGRIPAQPSKWVARAGSCISCLPGSALCDFVCGAWCCLQQPTGAACRQLPESCHSYGDHVHLLRGNEDKVGHRRSRAACTAVQQLTDSVDPTLQVPVFSLSTGLMVDLCAILEPRVGGYNGATCTPSFQHGLADHLLPAYMVLIIEQCKQWHPLMRPPLALLRAMLSDVQQHMPRVVRCLLGSAPCAHALLRHCS